MGSRGPLPRPDSSTCKPLSIRGLETLQRQVAGGAEGSTAHMYQLLRMLNAVGSVKGRSHFRGVVLFGIMPGTLLAARGHNSRWSRRHTGGRICQWQ